MGMSKKTTKTTNKNIFLQDDECGQHQQLRRQSPNSNKQDIASLPSCRPIETSFALPLEDISNATNDDILSNDS
jgi:hypothetical protein